ncbi:MAG: 23S rRNA (guanosine(2251)-2'-O)-methyltransferase RlmB [Crocinitomicaceae bacterium]|nr:23S rRNA (guanosine(2251)-2'-O)-methyltransferase RlmB [Crocinitomicaceae bacterium]
MVERNSDFIFGLHPVQEALKANKTIDKILISRDLKGESVRMIRGLSKSNQVQVKQVPEEKLNRITRKNHQGIIAFISPVDFHSIEDLLPTLFSSNKDPLLLILDGVTDVRNFGSMLRTAECMGVDAVIMPARNSVAINADVVKTSTGAIYNIPICKEIHFGSVLQYISESGCKLIACSEKAKKELKESDLTGPIAIIMGDEGSGIDDKTLGRCNDHIKIPMSGKTGSLNVAVSTGMVLYEVVRQKG